MKNQESGPRLALYMTSGCHLCEQAEALLEQAGLAFSRVEIADNVALLERYGVRIPVVRRLDTGQELDWPVDAATLAGLR
jgi:hypothetical protein